MIRTFVFRFAIVGSMLASPIASHALPDELEGEFSLSTGLDYREGDYGGETTSKTLYLPLTLGYLFDQFSLTPYPNDLVEFEVMLPWLWVDGPVVADGFGETPLPEPSKGLRNDRRNGLGDLQISASYLVFPEADSALPAFEFSGRVKVPTGSKKDALSTGKPAYTVQVDLFKSFGKWTPFASGGYRIVENAPGYALQNSAFTSLGVIRRINWRLSAGIFYDWWQSGSEGYGDAHEVFPYASFRVNQRLTLSPYAVIGLSEASTRWGLGMALRFSIPVRNAAAQY